MGYLCMTIVLAAWTTIAFVYRWAERKQANRFFMGLGMSVAGTLLILGYSVARGIRFPEAHVSQVYAGIGLAVVALAGIPLFMAAVARGDLSISWTVLSLSFALASVLSMIYPGEKVTALGVAGLVLAAVAVAFLGLDMYERHRSEGPSKPRRGWGLFMSLSFCTNALSMYGYKLASALQPDKSPAHNAVFLLTMYGLWAAGSLIPALWTRRAGSPRMGLAIGTVGGTLLVVGGFFSMFAFDVGVPGFVLFPATTGGSNVLVVVISVFFLGERPGRWGWLGIIAGVASFASLIFASPTA